MNVITSEKFTKLKIMANEYGMGDRLNHWLDIPTKPSRDLLPHNKPGTRIKIADFASPEYVRELNLKRNVIEVDDQCILAESRKIVLKHCNQAFVLSDEQITRLKAESHAQIHCINGFSHLLFAEDVRDLQKYHHQNNTYENFLKDLKDTDYLLNIEIKAEQAHEQHLKLKKLPFNYYVAIKVNWRLLHERSQANGVHKAMVHHITLSEDLQLGRLKRQAGEMLCGGTGSIPNTQKYDELQYNSLRYGAVPYQVTCKQCLEKAQKILKD